MSLETITPTFTTCKCISQGSFIDSALVWEFKEYSEGKDIFHVVPRNFAHAYLKEQPIPAPTLEEILGEMEPYCDFCNMTIINNGKCYSYPTTAQEAMELWLELNKKEIQK